MPSRRSSAALALVLATGCASSGAAYLRIDAPIGIDVATRLRATAAGHDDAGAAGAREALAEYRRLIRGGFQEYAVLWRASTAASAVYAATPPGGPDRTEFAREARAYAARAAELRPDGVEGRFAHAVALGILAESSALEASPGRIAEEGRAVVALDPKYAAAGGNRLLGLFHLRAPDLVGGDLDKAIENLREAVRLAPDFAENRLALAEALLEDGKAAEAREQIAAARALGLDRVDDSRAAALAGRAGR